MFQRNEGTLDRVLRIGVGLGLISLVFVGPETVLGGIGLVPLGAVRSVLALLRLPIYHQSKANCG